MGVEEKIGKMLEKGYLELVKEFDALQKKDTKMPFRELMDGFLMSKIAALQIVIEIQTQKIKDLEKCGKQ